MSDTETAPAERGLVQLDPRDLADHPLNVRAEVNNVRDLIGSIRALGVLEPLVITPAPDGGWRIIAGHRRCRAAIDAGLEQVPCIVRADLAEDVDAVTGMLVENLRREQLSTIEEARGYQQLQHLGLSATKIARQTGSSRKHIQTATAVAANEVAASTVEHQGLTLEQAMVVTEFDENPDAVDKLVNAALRAPASSHTRPLGCSRSVRQRPFGN